MHRRGHRWCNRAEWISSFSTRNIVGIHFPHHVDLQIKWIKAGVNIVLHSVDMRLFQQQLHKDLTTIRAAIGDEHDTLQTGFSI